MGEYNTGDGNDPWVCRPSRRPDWAPAVSVALRAQRKPLVLHALVPSVDGIDVKGNACAEAELSLSR